MVIAMLLAATLSVQRPPCTENLYATSTQVWEDDTCVSAMNRFLLSPDADGDAQFDIIWAAAQTHHIEVIRPAVEYLLRYERDEVFREKIALALVIGLDDEDDRNPSDALVAVFLQSTDIVHREATLLIAEEHPRALLRPEVRRLVVASLVDLMTNAGHSAFTRGRAIEACKYFARDEPVITATLLQLSRPDRWFDGVPGAHSVVSSIVDVIQALGTRQCDPAVAARLREIPKEICSSNLSDFDIWLCERELDWAKRHPD
jgi:hypothetical protein